MEPYLKYKKVLGGIAEVELRKQFPRRRRLKIKLNYINILII